MKKEIGKYIAIILGIICIILAIALICIKVSSVNAQEQDKDLREKISEEIKYLDSNITDIMNKINNITVIKYKVYTKEINQPQNEKSSQGSSEEQQSSEGDSENSSEQSGESSQEQSLGNQGQSNEGSSKSQENSVTVSELVPNVTLNQNSQEVDWEQISFMMENIYSTWPNINLDLQKQGISSELISSFSLSMDGVIQSIKNKDKNNTLINLFNMYINIPKFSSSISEDDFTQNKYNVKLNILNAYTLVSTDDNWNSAIASVTTAKSYFSNIISTENNNENRKNSLQKAYMIIEDLERISQINDKDIFYMGYKNVIQELETL